MSREPTQQGPAYPAASAAPATFRQRLQERLIRDPGYISLSARWLGWLVALLQLPPTPSPLDPAIALAFLLSGLQLTLLSAFPSWVRFEIGRAQLGFGAFWRPSLDLVVALSCLYLSGGWSSPLYLFAATVVLAPSLRYGLLGASLSSGAFLVGYLATVTLTPTGFHLAFLPSGHPSPDLIGAFATPLVLAVFAAFLGEVLQRLRHHQARAERLAAWEERDRLAREIHDGVAQTLFMLTMSLESGLLMAQKEGAQRTASHLEALTPIARKALLELRNAMHQQEALALGEKSLPEALEQLIRDYRSATGCRLELTVRDHQPPPQPHRTTLFRMLQESLSNACHHAQADRIEVILERRSARVRDDGCGFDPAQTQPGRGLANLAARAQEANMTLRWSRPEQHSGTEVEIGW